MEPVVLFSVGNAQIDGDQIARLGALFTGRYAWTIIRSVRCKSGRRVAAGKTLERSETRPAVRMYSSAGDRGSEAMEGPRPEAPRRSSVKRCRRRTSLRGGHARRSPPGIPKTITDGEPAPTRLGKGISGENPKEEPLRVFGAVTRRIRDENPGGRFRSGFDQRLGLAMVEREAPGEIARVSSWASLVPGQASEASRCRSPVGGNWRGGKERPQLAADSRAGHRIFEA